MIKIYLYTGHWKYGRNMDIIDFVSDRKLSLNAPIATIVVCFSRLLKFEEASMTNSVDPDQTAPIGAVCSGSTLFASLLYSLVMFGSYLQQRTSADDIFRCIFTWRFKGYKRLHENGLIYIHGF